MSAHMVHTESINVLVHAAINLDPDSPMTWPHQTPHGLHYMAAQRGHEDEIGQMLTDANTDSLAALYGHSKHHTYRYQRPRYTQWSPTELLGILNNYEYQACEIDDWETCEAARFCRALRRCIETHLPGASNAPWGIDTESRPAAIMTN